MTKLHPIEYSVVTGKFYRGGTEVGCPTGNGYVTLWYGGKQWLAHRLAYHLVGAPIPPQVDHANGNRMHNHWHNLRDACNRTNQEARHKVVSAAGLMGVSLRRDTGKFQAHIKTNGKKKTLGCFTTAEAAHAAYLSAKESLHTLHPNR